MTTSSSSSSSSIPSSSLSPSNSLTTCNLAENQQRRTNAGSRLPQILAAEQDLSLPMDLSDGAAGNFSATVMGYSDDIRNGEFDGLHADPLQVDKHEDSGVPYQNGLLAHPEEGPDPGPQGIDPISVLTVHCSCGTIVDDGKPLMPYLNCGKHSHVSCAGYTVRGSKMKRTKFYCHLCKVTTTKPPKKQSKFFPLTAGTASSEASSPNPSFPSNWSQICRRRLQILNKRFSTKSAYTNPIPKSFKLKSLTLKPTTGHSQTK